MPAKPAKNPPRDWQSEQEGWPRWGSPDWAPVMNPTRLTLLLGRGAQRQLPLPVDADSGFKPKR